MACNLALDYSMSPLQVLETVRLREINVMLNKAFKRRQAMLADLLKVVHTADPKALLEKLMPPKLVDPDQGWKGLANYLGRPDVAEKIEIRSLARELRKKHGRRSS